VSDAVVVRDPSYKQVDGWDEFGADVDGERVWFQVPRGVSLAQRAEPFVAAGLLEAMIRGVPLEVDDSLPLSPLHYESLTELQAIYHNWNTDLTPIKITARLEEPEDNAELVASFYSAGIDSSHTLLRQKEKLDALIFLVGFEGEGGIDEEGWEALAEEHQKNAAQMGKQLIVMKVNARDFCLKRKISWDFGHGLFLASVATLLHCKTLFIPSSHTYDELFPWGTHPLTDPMWSTNVNRVVHDGAGARRTEKTEELCSDQFILDALQVCWRSTSSNCGACPKCIRTIVTLDLLGASCKRLPPLNSMKELEWLKSSDESSVTFLEDIIVLARRQGNKDVDRRLTGFYRRYQMGQLIPIIDRNLLRGGLKKLYRRLRKPEWLNLRVTMRPKDRWL